MSLPRLGRPADRQDWIVNELREQIVQGRLAPGDRLPTRGELEATFGVSYMTVQRALDRLKGDGFVQVNGRNGTSVSMTPPHLAHYALVFPLLPEQPGWLGYYAALTRAAQAISSEGRQRLPLYHFRESDVTSAGYAGFDQLCDDILSDRLAGVITTSWPLSQNLQFMLDGSPIPRVLLSKVDDPVHSCIDLDHDSFWSKAMNHLRGRGCQRIACIASYGAVGWRAEFELQVAAHNMTTRPYWWQLAHPLALEAVHQVMLLMLHDGLQERPDGLVVSDDNFVGAAISGLLEAGLNVPEDIEVVAHCNFPSVTPALPPPTRLGYDARAILKASIASIDAVRRGEAPMHTKIAAVFENELSTT